MPRLVVICSLVIASTPALALFARSYAVCLPWCTNPSGFARDALPAVL
jgi:hypothetical protein